MHEPTEAATEAGNRVNVTEQLSLFADGVGLSVVLQPIIDLTSGRVVGLECLARFDADPADPGTWFAAAAARGMREQLELAAIRVGLACLPHVPRDLYLSVNVSPDVALTAELNNVFEGAELSRIVLEITEHTRIEDFQALDRALTRLRARGMRIALDDMGAGFAGLTQLLQLRPDIIKLDIDVVRGVDVDGKRRALISSVMSYAGAVGGGVVAEGVETPGEAAALRELGVRYAQGFGLARPQSLTSISFARRDPAARPRHRARRVAANAGRRRVRFVAAAMLLLTLAGATQAFASNAVPGSPGWPVKRGIERLRLLIATDPARRAAIHLELASRRSNELTLLIADRATSERVAAAMRELLYELGAADEALALAGERPETSALLAGARRNVSAYLALIDGAMASVCGSSTAGACGDARTALASRAAVDSVRGTAAATPPAGQAVTASTPVAVPSNASQPSQIASARPRPVDPAVRPSPSPEPKGKQKAPTRP